MKARYPHLFMPSNDDSGDSLILAFELMYMIELMVFEFMIVLGLK